LLLGHGIGFFQLRQDQRHAAVVFLTGFGQRHAARGPLDQTAAQMFFQRGQVLADHGAGQVQPRRGTDQAAGVDDGLEHAQGVESVHLIVS